MARQETGCGRDRFEGIGRRVVVATHRRSGTHLTIDLLRRQFCECRSRKQLGEGLDALYLNLDRLGARRRPLSEERALSLLGRAPRPIVKAHALPRLLAAEGPHTDFLARLVGDADLYCVVRDGREVLCSLHRYTRAYDPGAPRSLSQFLRQELRGESRVRTWARQVRDCLALPGMRRLAFEEIAASPRAVLARLGGELGLEPLYASPLLPRPLRGRWQSRCARLFSRDPEATTVPGGGRLLDWRRAFSRADREFFQREAGALLIELGYESTDAWVDGIAA
jgi:hypothetical protein